ncbi:MAG: TonB-dependent receptor [Lunatimonas sp.]|uniref:TonB-dependent receptor n=1 Tax=Lunatimonas sp. TaxID=2060141 RepID=UPI00263A4F54|nr:TonB-dependent receptor [Lunatimonas sp.]MCC5936403.1 TonB-dependent receptor [Lunatimonas sp.]
MSLISVMAPIPSDTVALDLVEVKASPLDRFAKGQQIVTFDSLVLRKERGNTLSELFQRQSGLFVRQYGPGMIASLTMRGTSAGHNAFFWNGLPISSPSLGQMDLSIVPVSGMDKVEVHLGSSGAHYGTDAIGGAVHLTSRPLIPIGWHAEATAGVGSFGLSKQEFGTGYASDRFRSRTRVYRRAATNRYPYQNLAKPGVPTEMQEHAAVRLIGMVQDLSWDLDLRNQLSSSFWWNAADRQIQPLIGSNTKDVQTDQSFRWVLDFNRIGEGGHLNLKAGWVRDEMVFNHTEENTTDQFLVAGEMDWSVKSAFEFKSGVRATYFRGNLSTYTANDERIEVYHATNYTPAPSVTMSLGFRQLMYGERLAPFTPCIGVDWTLVKHSDHVIIGKVAASRSYKVPTLNDRYWVPGGNPDLRSETALSGEVGLHHRFEREDRGWETRITYYVMRVDDWIIWLPGAAYWSPENIREVGSNGVDLVTAVQQHLGSWKLGLTGSWGWTNAVILRPENESRQEVGNQLPYTPTHKAQLGLDMQRGRMGFYINGQWVGRRFISVDNQNALPSYGLLDGGWRYVLPLKQQRLSLGFQIYNVLNTDYQVLRLRPMPGRNYELNLTFTL